MARQRAGISQAQLAKKLGKSRSSINEYESGKHKPKYDVLARIAKLTGTTAAALIA